MDTQSAYSGTDVTGDIAEDIDQMSTKMAKKLVSDMRMQNDFLQIEVNMLEKTWKRSDPIHANDTTSGKSKL